LKAPFLPEEGQALLSLRRPDGSTVSTIKTCPAAVRSDIRPPCAYTGSFVSWSPNFSFYAWRRCYAVAGMKTLLAMGPTSMHVDLVTAFASMSLLPPRMAALPMGVGWTLEDLIDPISGVPFVFMPDAVIPFLLPPHQRCLCWPNAA
jgi:hypothetical protein